MLLGLLIWLDGSSWGFWTVCIFVYAIVLALCFAPETERVLPQLQRIRWWGRLQGDAAFVLALAVMLLAFRWPVFFFPQELNPDESGYIGQTLTLRQDPMFWRSVTSGTSGPINAYPRLLASLLGMPDTFFGSRVMALSIVIGCLAIFFLTCRRFASSTLARLATLAPATFFALTTNGDFTHWSGEHLPMLLLAVVSYIALCLPDSARRTSELSFLAGCVLGAVPFAKLQGGVLALTIAVFCYVFLLGRSESWNERIRRCGWLTLGGGTVPAIVVLLVVVSGSFEHFWQSYIVMNLGYTSNGGSWAQIIAAVPSLRAEMPDFSAYFLEMIVVGLMGLAWITLGGRWRNLSAIDRRLLSFSSVILAVAIFTSLAPGRPFPHYFLFIVLPVAGWAFATFSATLSGSPGQPQSREVRKLALAAWCAVGLAGQCIDYLVSTQPLELRGHVGEMVKIPRSKVAEAILRHTSPGQPLGLWGWMNRFHVETGTWQATSDVVLEYLWGVNVEERQVSSWRELVPVYFQNLYLEDFKRSKPRVFVDAVAPGSFIFTDRKLFGYETFPALAAYIDEHYDQTDEIDGIRIFVRKDGLDNASSVSNVSVPQTEDEQLDEAVLSCRKAVEINPDSSDAHNSLGNALLRKGQVDEAIVHYQRALELNPGHAQVHNNLGAAIFQSGRIDVAITHFQRAVELKPDFAEAHNNLGEALLRNGQADEAVDQYRRALELNPAYTSVQLNLGNALRQAGRAGEAIIQFESAIKINPMELGALNNLAWTLATSPEASLRNGTRALELARRASQLSGGNHPIVEHTLAAALAECGRFAEAAQSAERALSLAIAQGKTVLAEAVRNERSHYEAGKPFREIRAMSPNAPPAP